VQPMQMYTNQYGLAEIMRQADLKTIMQLSQMGIELSSFHSACMPPCHCHPLSRSHTLVFPLSCSLMLSRTITRSLSVSLPPSLAFSLSLSLWLCVSLTLSLSLSLFVSLAFSLALSRSLSLSLSLSLSRSSPTACSVTIPHCQFVMWCHCMPLQCNETQF
jgi:hypothetical protein